MWHAHFADDTDDVVWLPSVGAHGWPVLTKDKAMRRKKEEMDKIVASGVQMFVLSSGNMTAAQMAQLFLDNRAKMARFLKNYRGCAFVASVSSSGVSLLRGGAPQ
jgi:PIN like domain